MGSTRERKSKLGQEGVELELTPMIDVVFQLLIFFIVTFREEDLIAHLDVFRPAPDPNAVPEEKVDDMIRIGVYKGGWTVNGRRQSLGSLERNLTRLSSLSASQTILIECAGNSPHENLVAVLDLCSKTGLTNLSVVSL